MLELWEVEVALVEYSSSIGFKEDWGVRRETLIWLEVELVSFFKRIARPAANNSIMMRNRRIMIIGFTVFAGFPSGFSSFLFSTSV